MAQALQEPVSDEFGLPQANENLFPLRFSPKAAAWALAKSAPAKRAFREALTKGTLRPRTLKARRYMSLLEVYKELIAFKLKTFSKSLHFVSMSQLMTLVRLFLFLFV